MQRRLEQIDESIARYLSQLDSADRQGEAVPEAKITRQSSNRSGNKVLWLRSSPTTKRVIESPLWFPKIPSNRIRA
jgi:hypothetical protein